MYVYVYWYADLIQIRKLFGIETVHISEHILIEMAKNENKESVQKYLKKF